MEEKWKTYQQWSQTHRAIVVCAKCGSTNIDHQPPGRAVCFSCNNQAHWSPDRFRLVRDLRVIEDQRHREAFLESTGRDWVSRMAAADDRARHEVKDDLDWHGDLVKAAESFLDSMALAQVEVAAEPGRRYNRTEVQALLQQLSDMSEKMKTTLASLPAD